MKFLLGSDIARLGRHSPELDPDYSNARTFNIRPGCPQPSVPGVSRSGATIAMGRALGYKREVALRYSFLLAIPAVLGSGAFELMNSISKPLNAFSFGQTLAATLTAFVIGYLVISWLMKYVQSKSFMPFVIYRVSLGTLLLIFLLTGVITA